MVSIENVVALVDAMIEKFENKQTNKKDDISDDFTNDDVSYPTVQAVKDWVSNQLTNNVPTKTSQLTNDTGFITSSSLTVKEDVSNKTISWNNNPNDVRYPSEKLVKDSLDLKANASAIPTKTSQLTNDSGYLTSHQSLDGKTVTVEKQSVADDSFAHTYVIKQGGSQVGVKINIPKDFLVKSGSVKTVTVDDDPVSDYVVGDKYLDFVINSKDDSSNDEHMYVLVSDLIDGVYVGDDITIELVGDVFSVKDGGIGIGKLDSSVTSLLFDGDYDSLSNKPSIPYRTSDLMNDGDGINAFLTQLPNHNHNDLYYTESELDVLLGGKSDTNHTHSEYVNPTIVDNLSTNDSTKVLSAKQGKVLSDLIGEAIQYING